MVHLYLKPSAEDPKLLQIAEHEDFYHPEDLLALLVPPLIPLVHLIHWFGTMISILCARFFQLTFGELWCTQIFYSAHNDYKFYRVLDTPRFEGEGVKLVYWRSVRRATFSVQRSSRFKIDATVNAGHDGLLRPHRIY